VTGSGAASEISLRWKSRKERQERSDELRPVKDKEILDLALFA
jgi:hypothetical protein